MRNLDWLYSYDERFREAVNQAAADWLGSTSLNFAGAWLMEQHKSDYEDLTGQHLDEPCVVPDREKQVSRITDVVNAKWEELHDSREKLEDDVRLIAAVNEDNDEDRKLFATVLLGLLDRQAAITERDVLSHPDERDEQIAELESIVEMHKRRCENLSAKLDYVLDERDQLQADADTWRAKCGALLDAAHEMVRIGGDA